MLSRIIFGLVIVVSAICFDKVGFATPYQYQQVIVQQKVVQFDANYYLGVQGYLAHGEALKNERMTADDAVVKELQDQNKLLKEILSGLSGKKPDVVKSDEKPTNPPEPTPIDNSTELEKKVKVIFKESCISCHTGTKSSGGLNLDDISKISLGQAVLIHHRTNAINLADTEPRMPKGTVALTDENVENLRLWLVEKAKVELKKIK